MSRFLVLYSAPGAVIDEWMKTPAEKRKLPEEKMMHDWQNWMADHAHGPAATVPLLVMDMYEHSYQMDFGAAAAKYIDAFFQNIRVPPASLHELI